MKPFARVADRSEDRQSAETQATTRMQCKWVMSNGRLERRFVITAAK